ncbi:MAG: DNA starvation/stationary phase protection protein [Bacteroidetes bacterium]|nr:DNA starvation/stationary phase protection protein [Bacteroidota bacterium]
MKNNKLQSYLNQLLATETAFAFLTRNAHWNLISVQFKPLHEYLGELYSASNERLDEIAERNRMIGGTPVSSFSELSDLSKIKTPAVALSKLPRVLETLIAATEVLVTFLKKGIALADEIGDSGTEDFLTGLLRDHEKNAWFLKSHLEK